MYLRERSQVTLSEKAECQMNGMQSVSPALECVCVHAHRKMFERIYLKSYYYHLRRRGKVTGDFYGLCHTFVF